MTKTKNNPVELPFQVQNLIDCMMNTKENAHTRDVYRQRIEVIKMAIDEALKEYQKEINQNKRFL